MKSQNYTTASCSVTIEVPKSPDDVFGHLTNDVSKFWPEEFEGKAPKLMMSLYLLQEIRIIQKIK